MIKHIVMWSFETEEICLEAKKQLDALAAQISEIVEFEAGINFNEGAAALDLALYSSFNSKEDLGAYQVHPAHKDVATFIGSKAIKRAVVDYEL